MRVTFELCSDAEASLRWYAEKVGLPFEVYLNQVVTKEAERVEHIKRSQPRTKLPAGRPRLTAEARRAQQLGKDLAGVYDRLRLQLNGDFDKVHGAAYRQLLEAIEAGDLATLERFERDSPWARRWST